MTNKSQTSDSGEKRKVIYKLEQLESMLKTQERLERRRKNISLTGIVFIVFFIALLIYRLCTFIDTYDHESVVKNVTAQSGKIIEPEMIAFLETFQNELLPTFSENIGKAWETSKQEVEQAVSQLAANLETELRRKAEERLVDTLVKSLEKSEKDIQNIFPDFSPYVLEKQIGISIEYYVEQLHDSLEERIALVASSLEDIKQTVESIGNSPDGNMKGSLPQSTTIAEEKVIDAFLDLLVYEIKPELGDEVIVHHNKK